MSAKVLLDTNLLNDVADGKIDLSTYGECRFFATHVQFDELSETPHPKRRALLEAAFSSVVHATLPTESAVYDVSKWDMASWSDGGRFKSMLDRLHELDLQAGKKVRHPNLERDILIGETAIHNELLLLSRDASLVTVVREFGGFAETPDNFLAQQPQKQV